MKYPLVFFNGEIIQLPKHAWTQEQLSAQES